MRKSTGAVELYRVTYGQMATDLTYGQNGLFMLPPKLMSRTDTPEPMTLILSNADSWPEELGPQRWEHASASWPDRVPNWSEMCKLKDLLFYRDEVVMQLHPAEKDYVNFDSYTLHLWKPIGIQIPTPPPGTLGPVTGRQDAGPRPKLPGRRRP